MVAVVVLGLIVAALWRLRAANDEESLVTTTIDDPLPGDVARRDSLRSGGIHVPTEGIDEEASDEATGDFASSAETAEGEEPTQPAQRRQELAGAVKHAPVSQEEEFAARVAISEEIFGTQGPFECDTICDCEPGEGCDTGAGICIPGLFGGRCCEWDDCPPGAPCVTSDGDADVCPE